MNHEFSENVHKSAKDSNDLDLLKVVDEGDKGGDRAEGGIEGLQNEIEEQIAKAQEHIAKIAKAFQELPEEYKTALMSTAAFMAGKGNEPGYAEFLKCCR